jgi:hypothetical protein
MKMAYNQKRVCGTFSFISKYGKRAAYALAVP